MIRRSLSPHVGGLERPKLPYNLLQLTTDVAYIELWDHRKCGKLVNVSAFGNRDMFLKLNLDLLRSGAEQLKISGKDVGKIQIAVYGELETNEDDDSLLMSIGTQHPDAKPIKRTWNILNGNFEILNQRLLETSQSYSFDEPDLEHLINSEQHETSSISVNRFLTFSGKCYTNFTTAKLYFTFNLAILSTTFSFVSIPAVNIIPSALSKGLSDPDGNNVLHGQPKTGLIALDDLHRVLLALESDPKLGCLQVFGIWISGVRRVTDAFVWAACARYFNKFHSRRNTSRPQDPFLIIIYDKTTFTPVFFDCWVKDSTEPEFDVFQAEHSSSLTENVLPESLYVKLERAFVGLTHEECLKVSNGAPESDVIKTPNRQNMYSSPVLSGKDTVVTAPQELIQSPPHQELFNLIKSQQEELNVLRAQIDNLKGEMTKSSDVSTTKETTSTSTMTSLLWTTPASRQHSTTTCKSGSCGKRTQERFSGVLSPQLFRKDLVGADIYVSPTQLVEESMQNLQLQIFSDVASPESSIEVDINEYTETSVNNGVTCSDYAGAGQRYDEQFYHPILSKINSVMLKQNPPEFNLLRYSSRQANESPSGNTNQKSIFDSVLIPHVNYVTLFPSEKDNDFSVEFTRIAKKYSNGDVLHSFQAKSIAQTSHEHNTISTSNFTIYEKPECGLSYTSQQYLQKYGLGWSKTNNQKNV